PSLTVSDLKRLVDAAAETSPDRASRDRALVALHCFTGLRPEEIVTLRWESLVNEVTPTGTYMLLVCVERAGRSLRLPVLEPAAEAVRLFAWYLNASIDSLSGPVFSARRWPEETLAYRTARDILAAACRRAGLPRVEAVELRSALANWLHSRGLSEHEVRDTLGINRVRSVDRLLERHTALEAQRRVREILDR
ncbi:MAG: tyrosine-type recombinase/integrase, partial [Propionibacteriaceae bacterium]|nr:tyrosine-type recombinase/integrase [Propionibacteriaceae bacterium]